MLPPSGTCIGRAIHAEGTSRRDGSCGSRSQAVGVKVAWVSGCSEESA